MYKNCYKRNKNIDIYYKKWKIMQLMSKKHIIDKNLRNILANIIDTPTNY